MSKAFFPAPEEYTNDSSVYAVALYSTASYDHLCRHQVVMCSFFLSGKHLHSRVKDLCASFSDIHEGFH